MQVEQICRMGPIIKMQVHEKKTRTSVFQGFFISPVYVDSTYIDKRALMDPSQSDLPDMLHAVALGLFDPPEITLEHYGYLYTWKRSAKGDALARARTALAGKGGADGE